MLKKLLLISIIILSSAIVLQAQENERHWDEGKISWNDFSGAYCYMDTRLSWVNPEFKNPLLLRYNQLVFDIVGRKVFLCPQKTVQNRKHSRMLSNLL